MHPSTCSLLKVKQLIEWYRTADGTAQPGGVIEGGNAQTLDPRGTGTIASRGSGRKIELLVGFILNRVSGFRNCISTMEGRWVADQPAK